MAVRDARQAGSAAPGEPWDSAQLDIPAPVDDRPQWMIHLWKEGVSYSKAVASPRPHPLEQFPPDRRRILARLLDRLRRRLG